MIGFVGGTGAFAQGLAARLRAAGEDVILGSRTPHDEFVSNAEAAARGDVTFFCVPPAGVEDTARLLAGPLTENIVVSVAAPVTVRGGRVVAEPGERSLAELVAHGAPEARVVAGFHTLSAKLLGSGAPLREDVLLAGDDEDAKRQVARLAELVVAGKAVDAGPLEVARWLEPFTAVLVSVNIRNRAQSGIAVTGLDG